MKYTAYLIHWRDSSTMPGWRSPKGDHGVGQITTIGWLIRQTRDEVTITSSASLHGGVIDALTIPRENIAHMQKLKHHVVTEN